MPENAKILVVEDNDFVRMQIVRYLGETGASVFEASRGDDALTIAVQQRDKKEPITLAIVDVRMEPVNGFEFIRNIRGLDMDTPVVLVTGDNNSDLLETAGKWGVSAVMIKPVQKERLINTVKRIIESYNKKS